MCIRDVCICMNPFSRPLLLELNRTLQRFLHNKYSVKQSNITKRSLKELKVYSNLDHGFYICQIPPRRNSESGDESDEAVCGVTFTAPTQSEEGNYYLVPNTCYFLCGQNQLFLTFFTQKIEIVTV